VVSRPAVEADLRTGASIRFSRDGRLAAVLTNDRLAVIDVRAGRTVIIDEHPSVNALGMNPRDAVFTNDGRSLLVVRADEGVRTVPIERWRSLDGRSLLGATERAVPRRLAGGELTSLLDGDS
jgi:hypothetical protein